MKTHIRILVQESGQSAEEFALQIQTLCEDITERNKSKLIGEVKMHFTTAFDGRQTASITFSSSERIEIVC